MKVEMQLEGLAGILETLKSLPPEIVSKSGGPVKLALKKGAQVIRDEAAKNLKAAIAMNGDVSTGLLEKNLIVSRGKAPSGGKGERYLVRIKRKPYDAQKLSRRQSAGKRVTTLKTAHLLEYGSSNQPATPWLRPAFRTKADQAVKVTVDDLKRRVDLAVKKLAKQNASKK